MPVRLRNTLAVLVMLLVCGASCQSAVCEIACVLKGQNLLCHASIPARAAAQSDEMDMSGADCAHMAIPPAQSNDFSASSCHDGSCNHLLAWASEKSVPTDAPLETTHDVVVYSVSIELALSARELIATKSPPISLASIDPLHLGLRV